MTRLRIFQFLLFVSVGFNGATIGMNRHSSHQWLNVLAVLAIAVASYASTSLTHAAYALGWRRAVTVILPKVTVPASMPLTAPLAERPLFEATPEDGPVDPLSFSKGYAKGVEAARGKDWQSALETIQQWPRQ